jgi:hypothetical protein
MVLMYIKYVFSARANDSPGEDAFQQANQDKLDDIKGMQKELWWFSGILAAKERR